MAHAAAVSTAPARRPPGFISQQVSAARRFYLNLRPKRGTPLAVVCGGWEECAPDYAIDRADFPFIGVELVATGQGELVLNRRSHTLRPGTVFVYGPGVPHRIRAAQGGLGKYFVDVTGRRAVALLRAHGLRPGAVVSLGATAEVRLAFDALIRLGRRIDARTTRSVELQFEQLLIGLQRAVRPGGAAERLAYATFERCRDLIDARFLEHRSVESVASAAGVNASYLSRLFRRYQGETPFRYLQQVQMQWAAERLHTSGRLVQDVADELGVDPFQFSRAFKRVHGVSPTTFLATRA